jgi:hypothetical protein
MGDFWSEPNHDTSADDLRCRRAVLVEGESDRAALEVLAGRRGRVLDEEGVSIVPMGELGFFVCDEDLEDELIRALGPDAVEGIIESQGELIAVLTYLGRAL